MNILFIEQHPRFIGGSERISLSICEFMGRRGHSTHLLHESEGDMVRAYLASGAGIHRASVRPLEVRRPLEAAASLARLGGLLRGHHIDIMFTSQIGYISLLAAARPLFGVRAVVHLGLGLRFGSPVFRWSVPRIAAGIAPSEHTRQTWLSLGWPGDSIRVIANGVDLARFRPADNPGELRASLGLPGDVPIVTYVGRLVEEKGVFTLLRAAALLKPHGPAFHLVLVGPSPAGEGDALRAAAAELGLGTGDISIRGATDKPESYYAAADAVAVPSEWPEPFGLAAIEAMASGAVPIVSDAGILPEIIGGGLSRCVFRQGDAAQLAERIRFVLTDAPARRAMREESLSRVRGHFDLARCGEAYERELLRCAKAK